MFTTFLLGLAIFLAVFLGSILLLPEHHRPDLSFPVAGGAVAGIALVLAVLGWILA